MLTEERQQLILAAVKDQEIVKTRDLMHQLQASESTIRRDLDDLEQAGRLQRIHGGARALNSLTEERNVSEKANQNLAAKRQLARAAVARIPADSLIFLDAGTTTAQMIPLLANRSITVVTTGVDNASLLADYQVKTYVVGGLLKSATKALVGAATAESLRQYRFDFAFIGTNGIHPDFGLTTPDPEEAAIKHVAIAQAKTSLVLADASKFDQISATKFADMTALTILTPELGALGTEYARFTNIEEAPQ
ncbi:DeoR/GlpR family DNA-binding transcription regulator [Lacticaseibacillus brantae]|uniref:Lactose transport regulator n=1 Tax=Lacticaseibacillus brantae DSM 23927 TaxID=1423727 RepID=A0A0R2AZ18_9LACO|nr:DeoR/GlpR family DNA-binding transcription regulator [Lacticaseibacillus brantae]KRM72574.1 lactose transport regulator [Lacticaseibacillus brantae DSM 23927]